MGTDLDAREWLEDMAWDQVANIEIKPALRLLRESGSLESVIVFWIKDKLKAEAINFSKENDPNFVEDQVSESDVILPMIRSFWGHKTESLFVEFKKLLDIVSCNYLILEDKSLSLEVYHRIKSGEITFSSAISQFGATKNGKNKYASLVNQTIKNLPYGLDSIVISMRPNQIIPPMRIKDEFCILQLLELKKASLSKETEDKLLFYKLNSWIGNVKDIALAGLE